MNPREKEARWQMVKPRLGLAGGVLFKVYCKQVPIITQPRKERKIKEHNTVMMKTRGQEWNKTPGIRPSLPPFTKYIDALIKIRDSNYIPTIIMFQQGTNSIFTCN